MLPTGALNLAIINPSGLLLSHLSGPLCCQSSHITDLYYSTFTSPMFWRDDDPISNSTLKTHLPEIPSSIWYPFHLEHIYTLNSFENISVHLFYILGHNPLHALDLSIFLKELCILSLESLVPASPSYLGFSL